MNSNKYYRKLINSQKWVKLRNAKMAQTRGLCERCEQKGITTPATEVHHIVPIETGTTEAQMKALCYDPGNLQALCRVCHKQAHIELKSYTKDETQKRNEAKTNQFIETFLKKP